MTPTSGWLSVLAALLVGARTPQDGGQAETPAQGEKAQVESAPGETPAAPARYRGPEAFDALFARWETSGIVERLRLGESPGGRPIRAVSVATPGPRPAAERTTLLVVGGLDGVSCSGAEAAVAVIEHLLANGDRLDPELCVIVVPWANPDGLARSFAAVALDGRNARPLDDDQDGLSGEDPPDDVDGDGEILSMLVLDPSGPLARAGDGRFLRAATSADAERWRLVREGRDDDHDGRYNEDAEGGVAPERNFPLGWASERDAGAWPLSEPEASGLAELALARRVAVAIFLQGNHGRVAIPGGTEETALLLAPALERDRAAFRALAGAWSAPASEGGPELANLLTTRGAPQPGAPIDWFYGARGTLAIELAPWGPERRRARPTSSGAVREGAYTIASPDLLFGVPRNERAWAAWLDDTRGGIGFVDWQPVELGDGSRALVGGWEARTCWNPPAEMLAETTAPVGPFVLGVAQSMPRLDLEVERLARQGGVVELSVRLVNRGRLSSGVGPGATDGVTLELQLPEGARLLAGRPVQRFGQLSAGQRTGTVDWLLQAREHAIVELEIDAPFCGRIRREVRL